jgi:peroxiredoxin
MSNLLRRRSPLLNLLGLLCTLALLSGCSDDEPKTPKSPGAERPPAERSDDEPGENAAAPTPNRPVVHQKGEKAARHPNERPVPAFEGRTLAGTRLAMRDLLGQRLLLFFFNPEVPQAAPVGAAVEQLNTRAAEHNFRVIGVGVGSNAATLGRFVKEQGYGFSVLDDSAGRVTQQLRLTAPVALLGIDADGYVGFGVAQFPPEGDLEAFAAEILYERLRVPAEGDGEGDGALYAWPSAPELDVVSMADGSKRTIASLAGGPAIVIFFLHTCPHCHKALEAIEAILEGLPEDQRPELVAISVQNSPSAIRRALKDLELDFFDPYLDPGGKAAERWGVTGGVPVVTVVDAEGRIRHRSQGWNEKRDGALLRMHATRAAGVTPPMLLDPKGYSGSDACGVCHEQEYATWQYTSHSTAFDTLVTHAADRRKDCVGCHVVGYEEPGGYDFTRRPAHLEDVGCESCHGRGGPHVSPGFVPGGDYAEVCATCHNATHSLGFDYATFHPRVSHTRLAAFTNAERAALAGGLGPNRELLPTSADYVGSDACQSCHAPEFETWAASPHGHAVATLEKEGKAGDADCLGCHTTAYAKPGGFPSGAPVAEHPDLARVGCESCHGPGGDHIGETAARVGTILSLGDKCDSCVILKVCGSCHDDANDPGFEFAVEERIEAQRHGTIESAATRAGLSAFHTPAHAPPSAGLAADRHAAPNPSLSHGPTAARHDRALLRHAFDRRGAAGERG